MCHTSNLRVVDGSNHKHIDIIIVACAKSAMGFFIPITRSGHWSDVDKLKWTGRAEAFFGKFSSRVVNAVVPLTDKIENIGCRRNAYKFSLLEEFDYIGGHSL